MAKLTPFYIRIVFTAPDVDNMRAYDYPDYNALQKTPVPADIAAMKVKMQAFERFRHIQRQISRFGGVAFSDVTMAPDWTPTAATPPPAGKLRWHVGFGDIETLFDNLWSMDDAQQPTTDWPNAALTEVRSTQLKMDKYILDRLTAELNKVLQLPVEFHAYETWTDPTRNTNAPAPANEYYFQLGMQIGESILAGAGAVTIALHGPQDPQDGK